MEAIYDTPTGAKVSLPKESFDFCAAFVSSQRESKLVWQLDAVQPAQLAAIDGSVRTAVNGPVREALDFDRAVVAAKPTALESAGRPAVNVVGAVVAAKLAADRAAVR